MSISQSRVVVKPSHEFVLSFTDNTAEDLQSRNFYSSKLLPRLRKAWPSQTIVAQDQTASTESWPGDGKATQAWRQCQPVQALKRESQRVTPPMCRFISVFDAKIQEAVQQRV